MRPIRPVIPKGKNVLFFMIFDCFRVRFVLGESENGFVNSDHMNSSLPKNAKSENGSFGMATQEV